MLILDLPSSIFGQCPFSSGSVTCKIVLVDRNINGNNPSKSPKVSSRLASVNKGHVIMRAVAVTKTVIPGVNMFHGQHDHCHVVVPSILQAGIRETLCLLLPLPVHHTHVGEVKAAVTSARAVIISAID